MNTIALYARVSSDRQKEEKTIASQTAALIERAQQMAYLVPKEWIFEDEGYSGAVLVRPGLEKLRDLAATGQIEAVLIYSPDRLSRKYAYQVLLIEEFARQGVEVIFIKSPKAQTPEEHLLLQFQGMIAEYERAQIAERTRRGKRHRARGGSVNVLSGAPYGYLYVKKTENTEAYYEIISHEAEVVRQVFELYTKIGLSINKIARWLNEQQIATRTGRSQWCRSTVWGMLRNPAYQGKACFGKTELTERQKITRPLRQRGGYSSRCSANRERSPDEWIEIPVPALISEQTFMLAKEQLEKNKQFAARRTQEPTLLQSLLVCQQCGYAYYRTSTRTSKRKIYYYRCIGSDNYRHANGRVCDSRPVRQDYLDEVVWKEILRLLEDPEIIQNEINHRLQDMQNAAPTTRRKETLQKEITRVCKSIERLLDAYQEALISLTELRKRMPILTKREQTLKLELQSLESAAGEEQKYLRIADSLSAFLSLLRSQAETLQVIERQKIIRLLVKEILIGKETITIRHSIPMAKADPKFEPQKNNIEQSYLLRPWSPKSVTGQYLFTRAGQRTRKAHIEFLPLC
jgi:site-specific DNA recombinase